MSRNTESSNSPDLLIFATSSLRKGYGFGGYVADRPNNLVTDLLRNHRLDLKNQGPALFHHRLEQKIPNGDNQLSEGAKLPLGTISGIPVEIHAQRGETESNEAESESQNKVQDVVKHYRGEDVLIFASDVVSENPHSQDKLGKPYKLPEYSKKRPNKKELEEMRLDYISTYYPPGTEIVHAHSFSMIDAKTENRFDITARTIQTVPHNVHEVVKYFYRFSGGAGIAQQLVNWETAIINQITNQEMNTFFAQLMPEKQKMWFYLHLIGVPSWQVVLGLKELTLPKKTVHPVSHNGYWPVVKTNSQKSAYEN